MLTFIALIKYYRSHYISILTLVPVSREVSEKFNESCKFSLASFHQSSMVQEISEKLLPNVELLLNIVSLKCSSVRTEDTQHTFPFTRAGDKLI